MWHRRPIIVGLPAIAPLPFAPLPTVAAAIPAPARIDCGPLIAAAAPPPVVVQPPSSLVAQAAPPWAILAPPDDGLVIAPPVLAYADIPGEWRVGGFVTGALAVSTAAVVHAVVRRHVYGRAYAPPPLVVYAPPPVILVPRFYGPRWGRGPGWGGGWGHGGGHWDHRGRF